MATVQGPTVARRRLRVALRTAREAAGLTQDRVAEAMDWSLSKLIRIEAGTVSVSTNDVKALLQLYGVDDETETGELVALARAARQRAWWAQYRDAVPTAYEAYIGLEAEASALYFFQPLLIPGLLHTEEYARVVIQNTAPGRLTEQERDARVQVRLTRQRTVLERDEPPAIDVILDESTLYRVAGSVQVMREQLLRLVALGSEPHVTIRVLPYSAGVNMVGPFIILSFPEDVDNDVVYVENALNVPSVLDRQAGTGPYRRAWQRLRDAALDPAESLALIAKVAGELD